jgi:thioredoxin-related protein
MIKSLRFILVFVFVVCAVPLFAQEKTDYEPYWLKNYAAAQDSSLKCKKPILISFSGSDWCKPCIKLRTQILDTPEFMDFATSSFVLVHADFPFKSPISKEQRKHNEALADKFNKEGSFPKIVIVNAEGNILYSCGYIDCSPAAFIQLIKNKLQ